jgi:hypothetical protein
VYEWGYLGHYFTVSFSSFFIWTKLSSDNLRSLEDNDGRCGCGYAFILKGERIVQRDVERMKVVVMGTWCGEDFNPGYNCVRSSYRQVRLLQGRMH